jgi:predicted enzyme related to lactoylglutathione lyase
MSDKPQHGTFCWNELATKDAGAAAQFYTELLGWSANEQQMGPTKYTTFKAGDKEVGGMLQMTEEWGDMPPHWMAYIAVDDVDASAKKVEELGGKVCVPPTDIPSVGRFCVVNDPTGSAISLITLSM